MRKKLRVGFWVLVIVTAAWMVTGCGDKAQDNAFSQTEEISRTEQSMNEENDAEQENDKEDGQDETEQGQTEGESSNESTELSVDVESIGDNSVVGNKIFIETNPDGNGEIMLVGVGGDNQVLVTVYFAEDASYVYETIRNGGADVETREGSFSDIGLDMILDLTGYYKGEDFYADKVVISNVILD